MPLISIVMCTYNRADLLVGALETVIQQSLPQEEFEVIVVDNNSNDHTRKVIEHFSQQCSNLRYVFEKRQGISYARNTGLAVAKGEYVGYTDDDCRVTSVWLSRAKHIIKTVHPAAFGGPSSPIYTNGKPVWFKDSYVSRPIADKACPLPGGKNLAGYNIFFRRNILEEIGGFDPELGMNGRRVAYGEDIAVQMTIRQRFPDEIIFFDPDLMLYHLIRTDKMTLPWMARSFFAKGRYVHLITYDENTRDLSRSRILLRAGKALARLSMDLTFGVLGRDRKKFPYAQNYFCEKTSSYVRGLGRLFGQYETLRAKNELSR